MAEELLANQYRMEIPLPGSPLGWVNSYVIKDPRRNLIIDTGLNRKECLEAMLAGLAEIDVYLKKTDFYMTHFHADHFAFAQLLVDDTATVYMKQASFVRRPYTDRHNTQHRPLDRGRQSA